MPNLKYAFLILSSLTAAACSQKTGSLRVSAVKTVNAQGHEQVEIAVTGDKKVPVRALDPVLIVGGQKLRHYRYGTDRNTITFIADKPQELAPSASMKFAWSGEGQGQAALRDEHWQTQDIAVDFDPKTVEQR